MADDPNKQDQNDGTQNVDDQNTDWKAKYEQMRTHAREWESKAKANKDAADELEKLKAQNLSEQEKAIARAEKAEAELQKLRASAERAEVYARIASKTKLPLEVVQTLNGEDEDALTQQANSLKKLFPSYPDRDDDGGGKSAAKKTNADRFAEALGL
jgi:DNA repair exonuclease SbcCD ATPase subunit